MQVAKACVVPVCEGQKFSLVHKFPADIERFNEWIKVIQEHETIYKLKNLSQDAIRKRYFICCRHFGMSSYKNVESRSLNLTAYPHLNLTNLDDYKLSKAYQLDTTTSISECLSIQLPSPAPTILNAQVSSSSKKSFSVMVKTSEPLISAKRPHEDFFNHHPTNSTSTSPVKKQARIIDVKNKDFVLDNADIPEIITTSPCKTSRTNAVSHIKAEKVCNKSSDQPTSTTIASYENPETNQNEQTSQNKLLALIEVTPEQYKKLSQSLSATEKNTHMESLMSFFNDNENDVNSSDNELELRLDNDRTLKIDSFWLRDHCRCKNCYDHLTFQRKINILDIPDDIAVKSYKIEDEKVTVSWSDDHESVYDEKFLIKNQYESEKPELRERNFWTKEIMEIPIKTKCRCAMRDYMSDPDVSKSVLESLFLYGVAFIDGVQPTQHNTEFVIRQLFPIHKTLFGEMWTFSDEKRDHSDTAYTNNYLGAHNDNTYFNDASGLQILHCIQLQQCIGGETFLIDGFQVANKIKDQHPDVFKRLTTTIVTAEYIEEGRHHKYSSPIIKLDPLTNEIMQIRYNLYDRAPFNTLPRNKIRQFYNDLKILTNEFENPENRIIFKLQPGTVMIFDNWRVLHGRLAYTGKRTMTGCYVLRTEYQSALRTNGFIE